MTERPEPLTPPECDLRDFPRMMLDINRLRGSEFDAIDDDTAWRAGFNLWMTAWHQVPAASLANDDATLAKAAGLGRDQRAWRKLKKLALRGWRECADGRLYHPVTAELALEAWIEKLGQRLSSGSGNAKRHGTEFDPSALTEEVRVAAKLLASLNPKSRSLTKPHVQKARKPASTETPDAVPNGSETAPDELPPGVPPGAETPPTGNPTGTPSGTPTGSPERLPLGSQGKGREVSKSSETSSRAPSAPPDADAEAWSRGSKLLVDRGKLKPSAARTMFGGLLKSHQLAPRDLLPSVVRAELNGTEDPQGYLAKAAKAIVERRPPGPPPAPLPEDWGDDRWRIALRLHRDEGGWSEKLGPEPGEPGCIVPAHLLEPPSSAQVLQFPNAPGAAA